MCLFKSIQLKISCLFGFIWLSASQMYKNIAFQEFPDASTFVAIKVQATCAGNISPKPNK